MDGCHFDELLRHRRGMTRWGDATVSFRLLGMALTLWLLASSFVDCINLFDAQYMCSKYIEKTGNSKSAMTSRMCTASSLFLLDGRLN